jgi:hypothetical protein
MKSVNRVATFFAGFSIGSITSIILNRHIFSPDIEISQREEPKDESALAKYGLPVSISQLIEREKYSMKS